MSTSLNEVVFELLCEVNAQAKEKNMTKVQKFFREPTEIFPWLKWHIKGLMCEYGRKNYALINAKGSPNEFEPTDKTFPDAKIAVYTVITGGYDNLKSPIYVDDTLDYYVITDAETASVNMQMGGGHNFTILPVPQHLEGLSSVKKQRYTKLHPDEALSENVTGKKYDYTIYIDGSLRITCDIKPLVYSLMASGKSIAIHNHCLRSCIYDEAQMLWIFDKLDMKSIKEQIGFYHEERMPEHFGLPETPVLIRKSNDPQLQDIMHQWWLQIERFTHRDQLSLPYVLWKNGLDMSYIFSLGNNVWQNPYFLHYKHNT